MNMFGADCKNDNFNENKIVNQNRKSHETKMCCS